MPIAEMLSSTSIVSREEYLPKGGFTQPYLRENAAFFEPKPIVDLK